MKTDRHLSIGIIGAGQIVTDVHLPVLLSMADIRVSWIADAALLKARACADVYDIPQYTMLDDSHDLPHAEVVLLAIPYGVREPYYSVLSERTISLYVEKPFSRTVEQHKRLCSWFPDYQLACGFQRRSWGPTLLVKQLITENLFGRLRLVRYGFGGPGIVVGGRYSSNVQLAGGGILFETGIHGIDALLFIIDAIDARIDTVKMICDEGFDLHTDAQMVLTTAQGEQVGCEVTVSCLRETIDRLEFTFDHAIVSYSLFGGGAVNVTTLNGDHSYVLSMTDQLYPLTSFQTFYEHWSRFLAGIYAEQANWTAASQSILTTKVIEQLYERGSKSM